jgi:addiction module HigA family antidote
MTKKPKPVHPGEILREEFMVPLGLSMNRVAMDLRVPGTRIADIVNENAQLPLTPPCVSRATSTTARRSG